MNMACASLSLVTSAEELQFGAFSARLTRGTSLKTDYVLLHEVSDTILQVFTAKTQHDIASSRPFSSAAAEAGAEVQA